MAIVTEISWADMFAGKALPDSPARTAFREAVAEIAEKAKITLPDCIGRVDSAVKIVLNGDVELFPGVSPQRRDGVHGAAVRFQRQDASSRAGQSRSGREG